LGHGTKILRSFAGQGHQAPVKSSDILSYNLPARTTRNPVNTRKAFPISHHFYLALSRANSAHLTHTLHQLWKPWSPSTALVPALQHNPRTAGRNQCLDHLPDPLTRGCCESQEDWARKESYMIVCQESLETFVSQPTSLLLFILLPSASALSL
jgi:hypothetical protein